MAGQDPERIEALEEENAALLEGATAAYLAGCEKARADRAPGWSFDMEAAPKDRTRILTFHPACPGAIIERARYDNWVVNEWRGRSWYRSLPEQPPIAWMPLLVPPKGGE
jgi:hypothetical protein